MTTGERSGKSLSNPGPLCTTECLNHRWQSPALGGRWFADYGEQQHLAAVVAKAKAAAQLDNQLPSANLMGNHRQQELVVVV
jgi:hypothetical protein